MTRTIALDLGALPPWLALVALDAAEEIIPHDVPVIERWTAATDERGVLVVAGRLRLRGLLLLFPAQLLLVRTDGLARVAQAWFRLDTHAHGLRLPGTEEESADAGMADSEGTAT